MCFSKMCLVPPKENYPRSAPGNKCIFMLCVQVLCLYQQSFSLNWSYLVVLQPRTLSDKSKQASYCPLSPALVYNLNYSKFRKRLSYYLNKDQYRTIVVADTNLQTNFCMLIFKFFRAFPHNAPSRPRYQSILLIPPLMFKF